MHTENLLSDKVAILEMKCIELLGLVYAFSCNILNSDVDIDKMRISSSFDLFKKLLLVV